MMHGTKLLTMFVGITLLSGCSDGPTSPEVGESFTLALGENVTLRRVRAEVKFLHVAEDSRCPRQVQCVWAGDGAVVVQITPRRSDAVEHVLHTNEAPKTAILDRFELVLLELHPYPQVPGAIPPGNYRATLVLYERLE